MSNLHKGTTLKILHKDTCSSEQNTQKQNCTKTLSHRVTFAQADNFAWRHFCTKDHFCTSYNFAQRYFCISQNKFFFNYYFLFYFLLNKFYFILFTITVTTYPYPWLVAFFNLNFYQLVFIFVIIYFYFIFTITVTPNQGCHSFREIRELRETQGIFKL